MFSQAGLFSRNHPWEPLLLEGGQPHLFNQLKHISQVRQAWGATAGVLDACLQLPL